MLLIGTLYRSEFVSCDYGAGLTEMTIIANLLYFSALICLTLFLSGFFVTYFNTYDYGVILIQSISKIIPEQLGL